MTPPCKRTPSNAAGRLTPPHKRARSTKKHDGYICGPIDAGNKGWESSAWLFYMLAVGHPRHSAAERMPPRGKQNRARAGGTSLRSDAGRMPPRLLEPITRLLFGCPLAASEKQSSDGTAWERRICWTASQMAALFTECRRLEICPGNIALSVFFANLAN